ncbi:hypothetical protein B0H19DRAFT_1096542 [Mycena capillaripes]|nr:hypothetical protein B0H19DRAFT_1096542 [Mycena capillaripes]
MCLSVPAILLALAVAGPKAHAAVLAHPPLPQPKAKLSTWPDAWATALVGRIVASCDINALVESPPPKSGHNRSLRGTHVWGSTPVRIWESRSTG